MSPVEIRRMSPEDLHATVAVWVRSRWDAQPWLEERMGHTDEDNLRYFRRTVVERDEVWVAVEDGVVVGLLALGPAEVDLLYVDPPRQGQGIGTTLLDRAKELRPGGFTLYTHQRNERARAFYERRGFRAVAFGTSPAPESEPDVKYAWQATRAG
jgi:ribosomal protein S18 acetylase RimI-like enzyme